MHRYMLPKPTWGGPVYICVLLGFGTDCFKCKMLHWLKRLQNAPLLNVNRSSWTQITKWKTIPMTWPKPETILFIKNAHEWYNLASLYILIHTLYDRTMAKLDCKPKRLLGDLKYCCYICCWLSACMLLL